MVLEFLEFYLSLEDGELRIQDTELTEFSLYCCVLTFPRFHSNCALFFLPRSMRVCNLCVIHDLTVKRLSIFEEILNFYVLKK